MPWKAVPCNMHANVIWPITRYPGHVAIPCSGGTRPGSGGGHASGCRRSHPVHDVGQHPGGPPGCLLMSPHYTCHSSDAVSCVCRGSDMVARGGPAHRGGHAAGRRGRAPALGACAAGRVARSPAAAAQARLTFSGSCMRVSLISQSQSGHRAPRLPSCASAAGPACFAQLVGLGLPVPELPAKGCRLGMQCVPLHILTQRTSGKASRQALPGNPPCRELGRGDLPAGGAWAWAAGAEAVRWARSAVWSRAFNLRCLGAAPRPVVPWLLRDPHLWLAAARLAAHVPCHSMRRD